MAELKTKATDKSPLEFLHSVENKQRQKDSLEVLKLMERATGEVPKMWGGTIIGFGTYHYKYASGHEGDWMLTGFSPRKQALTLYIMPGFEGYADLLARLGKFRTGKSCLYIQSLEDVDLAVLEKLVEKSVAKMRKA